MFLTLEDPRAQIKGSRDPLGVQTLWSGFGRHVVFILTTVTNSLRSVTVLLLGRHLSSILADREEIGEEGALEVFLRWEQVAGYARHIVHGVEGDTAWDLAPFARDLGGEGPPFRWDEERRFPLRAEIVAAFFHLYGLTRDDVAYVMDTFWIVRAADERMHGSYRTKDAILDRYDALAAAIRTEAPYESPLDAPPADPRCCHQPRERDA